VKPADLADAIRDRDAGRIYRLLFEGEPPKVRSGARTESDLWDYKAGVPVHDQEWARVARHVLAFHNERGGVLVFGVRDGDLSFCGATGRIDSKIFNDKVRRYVGDQIWVDFHREAIQADQRYLGVAIIPPRGPAIGYFRADAPEVGGKREFRAGESALRVADSSLILDPAKAAAHQASMTPAVAGSPYAVDQPFFRVLALETQHFVPRPQLGEQLERALSDPRTSVTSLIGIGGSGKTTLATWAALEAHTERRFTFIVSMTAKDRELTTSGIQGMGTSPTTYESLLSQVADVLGFTELKELDIGDQEQEIRALLEESNGLLYVDNLETVDDPRLIAFLDDLPIGVRALVTSRRSAVRVAVRPIDVGPLSPTEARALVRSLRRDPGLSYIADLSDSEVDRVADACDRLPLAIRWTLSRAAGAAEAVQRAHALRGVSPNDDGELLEFVFRRVFTDMTDVERSVMETLSIFREPSPAEVLIAGSGHEGHAVLDALEDLYRDALVQRLFDNDRNDNVFAVAPLTRSFVLTDLRAHRERERNIRSRLTNWYEARDVRAGKDRAVVRELRQGRGSPEHALVDLAHDAERRGDYRTAQDLYEQALARNPNGWQAARRYAEFERHVNQNQVRALELYERAGANAPGTRVRSGADLSGVGHASTGLGSARRD
jgi:tetratricopeptide (TPR) repeat protein